MPDVVKLALDRLQERYRNVQTGATELLQDWQRLTATQQAQLRAAKYFDRLTLLTQSVQNMLPQYEDVVSKMAGGDTVSANDLADSLEPAVIRLQDEMDTLNRMQAIVTGRSVSTANKVEPEDSLLRQVVKYAAWGLGLYFAGQLALAYVRKG
jgi:hypothetical protein